MSVITNGKYGAFAADVTTLINAAAHIKVSIFTAQNGAECVKDSNGADVRERLIASMNYTYPHIDDASKQAVEGCYVVTFADGASFTNPDTNVSCWYRFNEITPADIKLFA